MNVMEVDVLPDLSHLQTASVDIETSTRHTVGDVSNPYEDEITLVQVADHQQNVWILRKNFLSVVPLLINPEVKKIIQNFKFEFQFFKYQLGIDAVNVHDTLIAERMLNAGLRIDNDLGAMLARRCGVFKDKTLSTSFTNIGAQLSAEQLQYAATDVAYLHVIRDQQLKEISEVGMGKILAIENALVPIIGQMELDGVGFDREYWNNCVTFIKQKMEAIKLRVVQYLGVSYIPALFGETIEMKFNLNSGDQVLDKLKDFDCFLPDTQEATLQSVLYDESASELAVKFISDLLEWRNWKKMLEADYDKHINPVSGHIHASWNQIGARTGRLSCKGPNLQNVKKPVEGEPNFRAAFVPDYGYVYDIADFSQEEPKILAHISQDPAMLKAANEIDIYGAYGVPVYGYVVKKGSKERDQLKIVVLANAYGAGPYRIAQQLGCDVKEAEEIQAKLRKAFPVAHAWGDKQVQQLVQRGYLTSAWGRRRYAPEARGARGKDVNKWANMARNMPVQSTGSDIGKLAMIKFDKWAKEHGYFDARIWLAEHDELVVHRREGQDEVRYGLVSAMQQAMEEICTDVKAGIEADTRKRWEKV